MNTEAALGQNFDAICGITAAEVEVVWPAVAPLVAEALRHSRGELLVEDVLECLCDRIMQLWVAYDDRRTITACMVTQLVDYPRKRFLRIVLLSGSGHDYWQHGWDLIAAWAVQNRCVGVESFARRGLAKMFKPLGFREIYTVVGMDFVSAELH